LRADIGIYGYERQAGIYRGLISGYTASMVGFVAEERLDKMRRAERYCSGFYDFWCSLRDAIYGHAGSGKLTS
jgi:hypothetical protein